MIKWSVPRSHSAEDLIVEQEDSNQVSVIDQLRSQIDTGDRYLVGKDDMATEAGQDGIRLRYVSIMDALV